MRLGVLTSLEPHFNLTRKFHLHENIRMLFLDNEKWGSAEPRFNIKFNTMKNKKIIVCYLSVLLLLW